MTLLMWLAGSSPICLSLGSDTAADNIEVTKINGAAANGVRIKFAQANPSSGSLQIDLVRAALLHCRVVQLHLKAVPEGSLTFQYILCVLRSNAMARLGAQRRSLSHQHTKLRRPLFGRPSTPVLRIKIKLGTGVGRC